MSKYRAIPTTIDGIKFDSKAEGRRYAELKLMQECGYITGLKVHPRFVVWEGIDQQGKKHKIEYEGDFQYNEANVQVCEDVKGVETPVFRLKAKMFRVRYPDIELRVVK